MSYSNIVLRDANFKAVAIKLFFEQTLKELSSYKDIWAA